LAPASLPFAETKDTAPAKAGETPTPARNEATQSADETKE
jgi:hypothetical protein